MGRHQLGTAQLSSGLTSSQQFQFSLSLPPSVRPSLPPNAAKANAAICLNLERLSRQWRLDRRRRRQLSTIQIWLNGPQASQGECAGRGRPTTPKGDPWRIHDPVSKFRAFVNVNCKLQCLLARISFMRGQGASRRFFTEHL